MWKLKFSCPFYGLFWPVILAIPAAFLVPLFLNCPSKYLLPAGIALLLTLWCLLCALLRIPTKKDRAAMAQAKPLKWHKITKKIRQKMQRRTDDTSVILTAVFAPVAFIILYTAGKSGWTKWLMIYAGIFGGGILLWVFSLYRSRKFWRGIGSDAHYAVLPVHHTFRRHRLVKGHIEVYTFLVCYLPDGKYVFEYDGAFSAPKKIYLIRYRGRICWESDII